MVWLPDGKKILKICLFVLTECTNVTDGHTDRHCMAAKAALMLASRGNKTIGQRTIIQQYGDWYTGR